MRLNIEVNIGSVRSCLSSSVVTCNARYKIEKITRCVLCINRLLWWEKNTFSLTLTTRISELKSSLSKFNLMSNMIHLIVFIHGRGSMTLPHLKW